MMDASEFNRLLYADHYAPADLEKVSDLCRNHPQFGLAHMLRVRIMEALEQDKERALKLAAVYAGDRRKLHQLVTEVTVVRTFPDEPLPEQQEGIRFSDEPHMEADVIIEQHAPYAGPGPQGELLELDEDEGVETFALEDEEPEEISAETLIEAVEKDEAEMEDPEADDATPVIDEVEPGVPEEEELTDETDDPVDNPDPAVVPAGREPGSSENNRLILNFINEDPGPIRADENPGSREDVSRDSIREHDGFITDTLAKIYVKQGLLAKAIYAYEKLSLKYPEKSAYFAAQIEKIRNINHS